MLVLCHNKESILCTRYLTVDGASENNSSNIMGMYVYGLVVTFIFLGNSTVEFYWLRNRMSKQCGIHVIPHLDQQTNKSFDHFVQTLNYNPLENMNNPRIEIETKPKLFKLNKLLLFLSKIDIQTPRIEWTMSFFFLLHKSIVTTKKRKDLNLDSSHNREQTMSLNYKTFDTMSTQCKV